MQTNILRDCAIKNPETLREKKYISKIGTTNIYLWIDIISLKEENHKKKI